MLPDGRRDAAAGPDGDQRHWSPLVVFPGGSGLAGDVRGEAELYWATTQCPGSSPATWASPAGTKIPMLE